MIIIKRIFTRKKPTCYRFLDSIVNCRFSLSLLLMFVSLGWTQPLTASNDLVLSLPEAIQRTFENHPELEGFQHKIRAQQGKVIQSELSPKPEVKLSIEDALGSGDFSGLDNSQTTLSVSWVFDQSIKKRRTDVASREIRLIENERIIKQLDSATKTAQYFLNALAYQERINIAKRAIDLAESTISEIKKRVEVGKTPLAELYRAEAELAERKLLLEDLNHELESSFYILAAQWGSTEPEFDAVAGSLITQPDVISFEALKNKIMNNPNLKRFFSLKRVKQAELKLAQEERNPSWKFSTGVKRYEQTNDVGIVAGISIPFGGSNRNQGRIAEVQANISHTQSQADALRIEIETSLFVVYQKLEHSFHVGNMLKLEIIPRLEKALIETRKAYELGKYGYLEWMSVQNDLLDAQSALLDASLDAHRNKIELERLTGSQITSPFK